MSVPYSNFDLEQLLKSRLNKKKLRIFSKDDFENMTLKKMFGKENFIVIFLQNENTNIGHWITLIWRDKKEIEIFNSLGNSHDISFVIDRIIKDKMKPILANKQLQKFDTDNCGRFVILRILSRHKNINEFYKLFKNRSLSPDEISELLVSIQSD